jgi:hypothetical protein
MVTRITVAAFYADVPGQRSRAEEYLAFAQASVRALEITNPGARYVLLTDRASAHKFERHMEVAVVAQENRPLMFQVMEAQKAFAETVDTDLLVLPDVDCLANRDLRKAIPREVPFAITHKGRKFSYKINNLAYAHDCGMAAWFLGKALDILATWPADRHHWWGDQEAWGAVIGLPVEDVEDLPPHLLRLEDDILVAETDRGAMRVYPNVTHNCPLSNDGAIRREQLNAFMVHFKGERKEYLDRFMRERFR